MDTDSDTSSLFTLSPSLREGLYRYEGGRRHQASSDYAWPCDDAATKFELLCAELLGKTYPNGLWYEPDENALENVLSTSASGGQPRMLDLGCGTTASWSISMAERFPHVECIGVDLIPTDLDYLPSNLTIEVFDLLEGVPFPDDYFSLIHCRMGGCLASFFDNPGRDFLADVARALRPGGILLLEDLENKRVGLASHWSSNPYLSQWQDRHALRVDEIVRRRPQEGLHMTWGSRMSKAVRSTEGFAERSVVERRYEIPLGAKIGQGPIELQEGVLLREARLCSWRLQSAALGMDVAWIQSERAKDEDAFPYEDVGLFMPWVVVWAVKAEE